jgi:type IV secretion system protein VirB10
MKLLTSLFKPRQHEPDPDEQDSIEGERELGSVNKGLARQNKMINWIVACGACALAALFLYKYYAGMYDKYKEEKGTPKDITRTVATTGLPPLTMPEPMPEAETAVVASAAPDRLPPLQPDPSMVGSGVAPGQPPVKSTAELVRERRLRREVRFDLDGHVNAAAAGVIAGDHAAGLGVGRPLVEAREHAVPAPGIRNASTSANAADSRAYALADPTLMMTRGKLIPCTVLPAIDTTLTGIVTCVTGEDATGADNKVSLMDRGTICIGKQGGGVTQGQRRVGIVWQRCETPQHVMVPLASDAADFLGRSGIPGEVDNHFWDRFGSAIALSLITDIGPYLIATRQSGNNNTTVSFPPITGPKDVLTEVLKSTVNIPPTLTRPHAAQVLIYLAGDLDFRDVYQLERAR